MESVSCERTKLVFWARWFTHLVSRLNINVCDVFRMQISTVKINSSLFSYKFPTKVIIVKQNNWLNLSACERQWLVTGSWIFPSLRFQYYKIARVTFEKEGVGLKVSWWGATARFAIKNGGCVTWCWHKTNSTTDVLLYGWCWETRVHFIWIDIGE